MPATNYPYGMRVLGVPVLPPSYGRPVGMGGAGNTSADPSLTKAGPGSQVFFVNSAVANASDTAVSYGLDPLKPFKTLNFALTRTIANNGDVIYVGAGHVETVSGAAGLTFPTATANGVTVIACGNAVDRATINYTTSTAATVTIPALNVQLIGFRVLNSIDARVDGFIVTGSDCYMADMRFEDATGASSLISVRTTNAANRLVMIKTRVLFAENSGTARTEFLRIVGGNDHEIHDLDNDPQATFSTAFINNVTTATNGLDISDATISNGTTAPAIIYVSTSTGTISRSIFQSTGTSAATFPTQGSAFSIDADTVINAGTHQATSVQGSPIAFQKSIVSSTLTTSPANFITCTGGSIIVEQITVETDATGLAGGTNHQLLTDNANGLLTLAVETVANLGANKTVDLTGASVTALKKGFVLEAGKHLQLDNTVGAGTGGGKIFYNVYGRVLSGAPTLS